MNKLDKLFNKKQENILSVYCTAGYPHLSSTAIVLNSLQKYGADIVEIGIPFSDPVADGPVIQQSGAVAIKNGMTLNLIFNQLKEIKLYNSLPKILMGYFNSVYKYGVERFCESCADAGVDGAIIPDLPISEFKENYQKFFKENNLHLIFLVTPETSIERLKEIDNLSNSFIYAVSTNSTTGGSIDFNSQEKYFNRLKENLTKPFLIGFGVKDNESFKAACNYANGAIIGSAFIKALSDNDELDQNIKSFINKIKN